MHKFSLSARLLIIGFLLSGAAAAQTFESEQDIKRTIPVPADVVRSLSASEQARDCEATLGRTVAKDWFTAARIDLNGDRYADVIVKNREGCMSGPRAANWWIFAGGANGYRKVFEETGASITIGKKRSSGFRDIRHEIVMLEIYRNLWKYDGRRYKLIKTDREKID